MNKYNKKQDVKAFVEKKKKKELPRGLQKASKTHAGQAKMLKGVIGAKKKRS